MFRFDPSLTAWWPVKVSEPSPDVAGTFVEHTFEVEFLIVDRETARNEERARGTILERFKPELDQDELDAIQAALDAHDTAAFARVIRNWRNIETPEGAPIPFSSTNLETLLKHTRVRTAIARAFSDAIAGDKARLGN